MRSLNKRGQEQGNNIFVILFTALIFLCMMFLGLGKIINGMMGIVVASAGLTGFEAFFYNNFILWIILIFIIWFEIAMGST